MQQRRDVAAERLSFRIPLYLGQLMKDPSIPEADRKRIGEMKDLLDSDYVLATNLL